MDDFFNTHPILPIFAICVNISAFFPIVFLMYLVYKTSFHSNCRYLFYAWLAGYFALFSISISISCVSLTDARGFLAQSLRSSPYRELCYSICVSASLYCSMSEIALAVERIYSTIEPEKYHRTPLATRTLVLLSLFMIDFSLFIGSIEFQYNMVTYVGILIMGCDVMTIVANTASVKYNRVRFNLDFESLNAKYQVKEAYQLATAMQPVYIAVFGMKCVLISSSMISLKMDNAYFIGYNEAFYTSMAAINASIVSVMLIRKHPQLRKHARLFFGIKNSVEPLQQNYSQFTNEHFKSLESYWD